MGSGHDRDRPRGPLGAPGPGSQPPIPDGFKPVVRTVPLRAVPLQLPHAASPPTPPAPPAPRPYIEEAPYVEVPTRLASMDDWPTDHSAAALFRPPVATTQPLAAPVAVRPASSFRVFALAALGAVFVGAGVALLVFGLRGSSPSDAGRVGEELAPAPPAPTLGSAVLLSSSPSAVADPSAAAPTPTSTTLPSSASAATSAGSLASETVPPEAGPLLSFEAGLTVVSSVDAEVVVQGVVAGRTNQPLRVRCGPRNVRLRGTDGRWLTAGRASTLACMQVTTLEIEPER